jgi:hypothetical protein
MRKLITVGMSVAAVALAAPALASADHVAGVTYNGTVTGGGTIELVVSDDGSEVTVTARNMPGPGAPPACTVTEATRGPLAISDHGFSLSEFDVLMTGSFSTPGTVSGSVRVNAGCDTGFETFTAETPVVWPDAFLEHAVLGFAGEDIYNTSGNNQVITQRVRQGKTGRFTVHIQNDGTEPDDIDVAGCGSSRGFRVTYTQGGENVTPLVTSGGYETAPLDTNQEEALKLAIKVSRRANSGKRKTCKVMSTHSGVFRGIEEPITDAVKAQVKVKRAG